MTEPTHSLYRFFNASGDLLYIGRTMDARSRWRSHEKTKLWFNEVTSATREIFADAASLAAAESRAIRAEAPRYNVVHNGKRRPTSGIGDELGALHTYRLAALGIRAVPESCGEPCYESDCECVACHGLRMDLLVGIEEDHIYDLPLIEVTHRLRREYAEGRAVMDWIYDLTDLDLMWPLEVASVSRDFPVPVLADVIDAGISVDCPYCSGCHEYFIKSGQPLDLALDAPCHSGGRYRPVLDFIDYHSRYDDWLDRHFKSKRVAS